MDQLNDLNVPFMEPNGGTNYFSLTRSVHSKSDVVKLFGVTSFYSVDDIEPTLRPPELLVGDDPNMESWETNIPSMNGTESPMRVELDMLPLDTWQQILVFVIKGIIMGSLILTAILGNLLVIVSVARYHKLRVLTNCFVVSMALADMLVALMAMVFNASVQLTGKWIFGSLMCDIWNSMDVYFSTVSILHLCCISIDRYTAIVQPLDYPLRMTKRTVAFMLAVAWISPVFISVLPIFLGLYTTQVQLDLMASNPGLCNFKVNLVYALVSSSMSFWIPGIIMLVMYYRIYKEADRQEMMVFRSTVAALLLNKHLHINGMSKGSVKITDSTKVGTNGVCADEEDMTVGGTEPQNCAPLNPPGDPVGLPRSDESSPSPTPVGTPAVKRRTISFVGKMRFLGAGVRKFSTGSKPVNMNKENITNPAIEGMVLPSTEPKKKTSPLNKMKRERKAAKTLGIIVSAFLLCWLPFFTWYLVSSLCGDHCQSPELLVTILFWIGYFNSTLNPVIYAYFNRDFRKAFRKTLKHYFVVCGCRSFARLGKKCCSCGVSCTSCHKECPHSMSCSMICPNFVRGDETPSSEIPPRSGLSSDYVHIEMTTVDHKEIKS